MHDELKMWTEDFKTNFYGQDVPYDMYCYSKAVLRIGSAYKQVKNHDPQL